MLTLWSHSLSRSASKLGSHSLAINFSLAGSRLQSVRFMGDASVWEAKKALRKETSKKLKEMDDSVMEQQSAKIIKQVEESSFFKSSQHTGIYLTCPKLREVDTGRLLDIMLSQGESGRRCYAPAVEDKKSNMNFLHVDDKDAVQEMPPYGITEPVHTYPDGCPRDNVLQMDIPLDLLIMTGQAFDRNGGRLGRGGGYYDKFIARCIKHAEQKNRPRPLLVALAFTEQVAGQSVPTSDNDMNMDILVLPDEAIACSPQGDKALQKQ